MFLHHQNLRLIPQRLAQVLVLTQVLELALAAVLVPGLVQVAQAPAVVQVAVQAPAVAQVAVQAPAVAQVAVQAPAVAQVAVQAPAVVQVAVQAPAVVQVTAQAPAVVLVLALVQVLVQETALVLVQVMIVVKKRVMTKFQAICSVSLSSPVLVTSFNVLYFVRNNNHVALIKNIVILLRKR